MKKKYLFISNIASPYQVKFCYALQQHFDAEFWFYEHIDDVRPEWWKIPLGDKCKVMKASGRLPGIGYFSMGLFKEMLRFKPDIVVLGGFMRWHILVHHFAKLLGAKVAVMSEAIRYVENDDDGVTELLTKTNAPKKINLSKKLFNRIDLYIGMGEAAEQQFLEEFEIPREKVVNLPYPRDIEAYFNHPLREKKAGDDIVLLFANRLVDRYRPLVALEVFKRLTEEGYPVKLLMNADGSEKEKCVAFIKEHNLENVEFLDQIDSWNNMHLVYKQADILLLPANYSNGNLTITEATASGMGMVLSNRINDIEINSANNLNCFHCNPDVDDFYENVLKYIHNPGLLKSHGIYGRELIADYRNEPRAAFYFETFKEYGLVD